MSLAKSAKICIILPLILVQGCNPESRNLQPVVVLPRVVLKVLVVTTAEKTVDLLHALISYQGDINPHHYTSWRTIWRVSNNKHILKPQNIVLMTKNVIPNLLAADGNRTPPNKNSNNIYKKRIQSSKNNNNRKKKADNLSVKGSQDIPSAHDHAENNSRNTLKNLKKQKRAISNNSEKMLKLSFQWPIKGVVAKPFHHAHNNGIEIVGKTGQPVYAAESGTVVYGRRWLVGFGYLLILKHNNSYLTAYANNRELCIKEGQHVQRGQLIAKLGKGLHRKPTLHFEIRKNGKSQDPMKFLPNN